MENYILCMDVSGDLEKGVAENGGVRFIPMEYSVNDSMIVCRGTDGDEAYKKLYDGQRAGDLTKTSQITSFMYEEFFENILKEGESVMYLCLSSGLSATYQSSCLAAKNLKRKYPALDVVCIDSLSATGGMGVIMERMINNKNSGMSLKENEEDIKKAIGHIKHWFMVEDLMYLKRGGRLSGTSALLGSMLNIKPVLRIDSDGKLVTIEKKRGVKSAIACLAEKFKNTYDSSYGNVVYVCDADNPACADALEEEIKSFYPDLIVRRTKLSPIIGAHTGPGMFAVCHFGKE